MDTIDYSKYVGCYVKRFYTPFLEKHIQKIVDFRYLKDSSDLDDKDTRWGDFQVTDGKNEWWLDVDDSVIITDEQPEIEDERLANIHNSLYVGFNPYDKKND